MAAFRTYLDANSQIIYPIRTRTDGVKQIFYSVRPPVPPLPHDCIVWQLHYFYTISNNAFAYFYSLSFAV